MLHVDDASTPGITVLRTGAYRTNRTLQQGVTEVTCNHYRLSRFSRDSWLPTIYPVYLVQAIAVRVVTRDGMARGEFKNSDISLAAPMTFHSFRPSRLPLVTCKRVVRTKVVELSTANRTPGRSDSESVGVYALLVLRFAPQVTLEQQRIPPGTGDVSSRGAATMRCRAFLLSGCCHEQIPIMCPRHARFPGGCYGSSRGSTSTLATASTSLDVAVVVVHIHTGPDHDLSAQNAPSFRHAARG